MTASLFPKMKTEDVFLQPQLSRYNHPFRSPFSSEKLNLEYEQIRYDIYKLNAQIANLENKADLFFNALKSLDAASLAIALGYIESIGYGSIYDANGDGVLDVANPLTGYNYTDRDANVTALISLVNGETSIEDICRRIQNYIDRIVILEEGL